MEPTPDVPGATRSRRYYELLLYRYVQELTQKETARRLQISPRHLRREQQLAVRALAQRVWEENASDYNLGAQESGWSEEQSAGRVDQIQHELALLEDNDPDANASVINEMGRAEKLMEKVLASRKISLALVGDEGLKARVHPSVLRQILIGAIEDLANDMNEGSLLLSAHGRADEVEIRVIGDPIGGSYGGHADAVWRMLATQSGAAEYSRVGARGMITLRFPLARPRAVLVIDDNEDVIHVFKRYTSGTRYQIHNLSTRSGNVAKQIAELQPDVLILDVLMPDIDGWELLAALREQPSTHTIPIVVCSVLGADGLAYALGAAAHLSKPVKRQQFLATLDRVCRADSVA